MQKVAGERYVYKFVCDPEALFTMAFPDNTRPLLKSEIIKDEFCGVNGNGNSNQNCNMLSASPRHHHQLHHGGHSPSSTGFSSPGLSHDSRDQPISLTVGDGNLGNQHNQHLPNSSHNLNDIRAVAAVAAVAAASATTPLSHQNMCGHIPLAHHHHQLQLQQGIHGEHSPPNAHMHNSDIHPSAGSPDHTLLHPALSPGSYPPHGFGSVHHDMAARMYVAAGPYNMESCVY